MSKHNLVLEKQFTINVESGFLADIIFATKEIVNDTTHIRISGGKDILNVEVFGVENKKQNP